MAPFVSHIFFKVIKVISFIIEGITFWRPLYLCITESFESSLRERLIAIEIMRSHAVILNTFTINTTGNFPHSRVFPTCFLRSRRLRGIKHFVCPFSFPGTAIVYVGTDIWDIDHWPTPTDCGSLAFLFSLRNLNNGLICIGDR